MRGTFKRLQVMGLLCLTVACVSCSGPTRAYVRVGPPAPIVETRLVAPAQGYVWIAGYHRWNGATYVWVPGRWERPPRPSAEWVGGHWVQEHRGWYFVDGHWR